ncbi:MAG: hypothetical protein AAFY56_06380 [Pseudomonadota bacterium]
MIRSLRDRLSRIETATAPPKRPVMVVVVNGDMLEPLLEHAQEWLNGHRASTAKQLVFVRSARQPEAPMADASRFQAFEGFSIMTAGSQQR